MTREAKQVRKFMQVAGQELPEKPTMPSLETRILRAKLMLEECLETIHDGLGVKLQFLHDCSSRTVADVLNANDFWEEIHPGNLEKIADGCADTKVVTIGTELACGIDGEPVMDEVMSSNMTKFPMTRREDGKIMKGPSYRPPDIASVLEAMR